MGGVSTGVGGGIGNWSIFVSISFLSSAEDFEEGKERVDVIDNFLLIPGSEDFVVTVVVVVTVVEYVDESDVLLEESECDNG